MDSKHLNLLAQFVLLMERGRMQPCSQNEWKTGRETIQRDGSTYAKENPHVRVRVFNP